MKWKEWVQGQLKELAQEVKSEKKSEREAIVELMNVIYVMVGPLDEKLRDLSTSDSALVTVRYPTLGGSVEVEID